MVVGNKNKLGTALIFTLHGHISTTTKQISSLVVFSQAWFDRRTNYTRSLAVMSMVGHVLGLGDRHPSNLMLDRISGKVVHIDFGDCFEVSFLSRSFFSYAFCRRLPSP